jgi:hypothetical protein
VRLAHPKTRGKHSEFNRIGGKTYHPLFNRDPPLVLSFFYLYSPFWSLANLRQIAFKSSPDTFSRCLCSQIGRRAISRLSVYLVRELGKSCRCHVHNSNVGRCRPETITSGCLGNVDSMQFVVELHFAIRVCRAGDLSVGICEIVMEDAVLRFKPHRHLQAYYSADGVSLA